MSRKEEIEARKLELRDEIEAAEKPEEVEELTQEVDALVEEEEQIEQQEQEQEVAEQLEEKSVIVLGNEKEGIPQDIINLIDNCIIIPQYGNIRSLNVHVSAAIMLWECIQSLNNP